MRSQVVEHHYLAWATEPIHIGGTRVDGAQGMTVRDPSGLPFIPATSLKGCCRANCAWEFGLRGCDGKGRECPQPHRCASCAVFGYLNSFSRGDGSSLVRFSAGTLVFVPFLVCGHRFWLTSPTLLRKARLIEDDEAAKLATVAEMGMGAVGFDIDDSVAATILAGLHRVSSDASVHRPPPLRCKAPSAAKALARAIVVDDAKARGLLQSATGTMSSVAIGSRTDTVRAGALYRTEFILPESVLTFSVTYLDPSFLKIASFVSDRDGAVQELPATREMLRSIVERGFDHMSVRGVGGKRSRGFGRLCVSQSHSVMTLDSIPVPSHDAKARQTVFISYAHDDAPFVRRLASALQAEGLDVWLDETNLSIGDRISRRILDGLTDAVYVVVVLSEAALSSRWVESEMSVAFDLEAKRDARTILPIVLDDYAKSNLPILVRPLVYADARKGFTATVHALMRSIRVDPRM